MLSHATSESMEHLIGGGLELAWYLKVRLDPTAVQKRCVRTAAGASDLSNSEDHDAASSRQRLAYTVFHRALEWDLVYALAQLALIMSVAAPDRCPSKLREDACPAVFLVAAGRIENLKAQRGPLRFWERRCKSTSDPAVWMRDDTEAALIRDFFHGSLQVFRHDGFVEEKADDMHFAGQRAFLADDDAYTGRLPVFMAPAKVQRSVDGVVIGNGDSIQLSPSGHLEHSVKADVTVVGILGMGVKFYAQCSQHGAQ